MNVLLSQNYAERADLKFKSSSVFAVTHILSPRDEKMHLNVGIAQAAPTSLSNLFGSNSQCCSTSTVCEMILVPTSPVVHSRWHIICNYGVTCSSVWGSGNWRWWANSLVSVLGECRHRRCLGCRWLDLSQRDKRGTDVVRQDVWAQSTCWNLTNLGLVTGCLGDLWDCQQWARVLVTVPPSCHTCYVAMTLLLWLE